MQIQTIARSAFYLLLTLTPAFVQNCAAASRGRSSSPSRLSIPNAGSVKAGQKNGVLFGENSFSPKSIVDVGGHIVVTTRDHEILELDIAPGTKPSLHDWCYHSTHGFGQVVNLSEIKEMLARKLVGGGTRGDFDSSMREYEKIAAFRVFIARTEFLAPDTLIFSFANHIELTE